jgi:hypothetical protein
MQLQSDPDRIHRMSLTELHRELCEACGGYYRRPREARRLLLAAEMTRRIRVMFPDRRKT